MGRRRRKRSSRMMRATSSTRRRTKILSARASFEQTIFASFPNFCLTFVSGISRLLSGAWNSLRGRSQTDETENQKLHKNTKNKKTKNKTKPKNQLQFETKENRKFGVDAE